MPFIHKFQSYNKEHYIYDVNTNQIIHVDQIVFDIIDDFLLLSNGDILSKWKNRYKRQIIETALRSINLFHKKGIFSTNRPMRMLRPNYDEFFHYYKSEIGAVILNITEQCNLRCKYCSFSGTYSYERKHSSTSMSDEIIKKFLSFYLSKLHKSKERHFAFYGGEPLLAFKKIQNIIQILSCSKKSKFSFSVDTNGTMLKKKEDIDFLIKNDCRLQISLDGPKEIHDSYRVDIKANPTFDKIIRNLYLIQKMDKKYYINKLCFIITIAPKSDLLAINEFFSKNELLTEHALIANFIHPFDTVFFDIYGKYTTEQMQQLQNLNRNYIFARANNKEPTRFEKSIFEKSLIKIHRRTFGKPDAFISPNGICQPGLKRLFINLEGKFHPCERVGQAFNIGDVDNGFNLAKIKTMIEDYINLSEENCVKCWAVRLCGICYGGARKGSGFDSQRKKEHCTIILNNLHNSLITYATIMETNSKAFDFAKNIIEK